MPKAFLSHSSKDKTLVRRVAGELNAANVHFDELTFEDGTLSADAIIDGLSKTDLFVLFASRDALASHWVQSELKLASSRLLSGNIRRVIVFLIDEIDPRNLPEWLRDFVYRKLKSAELISNIIRSKLIELDIEQFSYDEYFVGREEQLSSLKKALSRPTSASPICIQLSGWDGIGRRTLAKKAMRETYPWLSRTSPEVTLDESEAESGLFRALLRLRDEMPLADINQQLGDFEAATKDVRTTKLLEEFKWFSDKREVLYLKSRNSVLRDDGDFQDWLSDLFSAIPKRNYPVLVIISQRMVPPSKRRKYSHIYFDHVVSLPEGMSTDLLSQLLKKEQIEFDQDFLVELAPYVSGHPRNIQLAAEFIKQFGVGRVQLDKTDFRELLNDRAASLLHRIPLTDNQRKLVAIFGDYPLIAIEDLVGIVKAPDEEFKSDVIYLEEHGIIEWESKKYLRLAPYLIDPVSRASWSKEIQDFRRSTTNMFLNRVRSIETNDYVKLSTIDAAVLASLRKNDSAPGWLSALCLPSHYLHIAKEMYDDGKHEQAAQLCQKALDRSNNLTTDAIVEALRLRAMSLARLGEDDSFAQCLTKLGNYRGKSPRRNYHFVSGFQLRIKGLADLAESEFRKAYAIDNRNFHVLRELAQVLVNQERYSEAEVYARSAYRIAPTNVFIIDSLISVLVGSNKNIEALLEDEELNQLFQYLQLLKYNRPGIYEIRRAEFELKVGRPLIALNLANEAVKLAPHVFGLYVTRALIKIRAGQVNLIDDDIKKMEEISRDKTTGEGKSRIFMITVIKTRQLIAVADFEGAKDEIYRHQNVPKKVRDNLVSELITRISASDRSNQKMRTWAKAKAKEI